MESATKNGLMQNQWHNDIRDTRTGDQEACRLLLGVVELTEELLSVNES